MHILIPEASAPDGLRPAEGRTDIVIERFPANIAQADFRARLKGVNAVILGLTPFGEAECAAAPNLRAVARIGVGYDTVDVAALNQRKLPLLLTGIANSASVAEQALGFLFAFAKRVDDLHRRVIGQQWNTRFQNFPIDLQGRTMLIVGFGRIGSRMARRCVALDMRTQVYDPHITQDYIRTVGAEPVPDLNTALASADFVSIHCPKNPGTIDLFDARRLARMKKGAFLINTARGGIVNEAALADALRTGHLAGAGLDVFDQEPPAPDNPLLTLPNVITAPHMAGVTWEAWNRMAFVAMQNVIGVLDGKPNREHTVNPQVYD